MLRLISHIQHLCQKSLQSTFTAIKNSFNQMKLTAFSFYNSDQSRLPTVTIIRHHSQAAIHLHAFMVFHSTVPTQHGCLLTSACNCVKLVLKNNCHFFFFFSDLNLFKRDLEGFQTTFHTALLHSFQYRFVSCACAQVCVFTEQCNRFHVKFMDFSTSCLKFFVNPC